ncbi:MAG TPA: protein kinase [Polyangiaceae bacterium]|nr:protein kinase [Polyangiaceae bacterium]
MTGGDDTGPSGTQPLKGPEGSGKQALGSAPTVVDTRPSPGAAPAPLESAHTVLATPASALESARTTAATPASAFESARTAAVSSAADTSAHSDGIALRPFGPYTRIEALGQQGNMGVVARGYNHGFGRWELLKFLKPALAHDPELLRQFRREGRALARLSHPNVVQVFAMYDLDAQPCIAMEFLEGLSLTDELTHAGGRLTQDRAQELLLDAARGLSAAHELGLLHRDIKPDNLFVTLPGKGRVAGLKLIDFGLATADKARPEELQKDPSLASDATGGTPLFLAPEIWQGRDPTPLTDLYALGISFYFAVTGRYPFKDTALHAVVSYCASPEPPPSVSRERPELSAAFAALIDRLVDKNPNARWESAEKLVAELVAQRASARPRRVPGAGPYRGLSAFSESERDVFFGRERDIAEITERLRTQLGLLLVGPVACGKSSLLRAGIVPAIRDGVLGGGQAFEAVLLEPRGQPLRALAGALAPLLQMPEAELTAELFAAPGELRSLIERKLSPERGLVVVVDQLEELAGVAPADAARFARALESLLEVESPRLRLLAAVRSDVVDRLFALGSLRGLLTRGFHPLGPLDDEQLGHALTGPVQTAGYSFEDAGLVAEIAEQTRGAAAGLALGSLALARFWQKRDEGRRLLTKAAWESLGGVVGVLIEHADAVWESLGAGERAAAEDVVLRLISTNGLRDSARREALIDPAGGGEAARRALERLLASRLCVEVAGEVELVHDALATTWPRAKELMAKVGVDQQLRQRVSLAAGQWQEQNKPDGLLWSGQQADRLLGWFQGAEQSFTLLELEFVAAVRRQATRARRLRRAGLFAGVLGAFALCTWLLVRERRLSADLGRVRERSAASAAKAVAERARLYTRTAELLLVEDPTSALSDAQAAGRLVKSPALDPIAWQALALGVPVGLPLHEGGAGFVATDGEYIVTTGADALHALRVQGAGAGQAPLPLAENGKPPSVSALTLAGDAWLGTVDGAVFRGRYRLAEGSAEPEALKLSIVGAQPGGVREIVTREKRGRIFVCYARPNELAVYAAETGALLPLWHGAARDVSIDAAGERLAIATPSGEVVVTSVDGSDKPQSLGEHQATAVAWLHDHVVAGDGVGRLLLFGAEKAPRISATGLGGAVQRISVSRSEQALVAQAAGSAAIISPELAELARLHTGSPALRFLDSWRAVALVDEHQNLVVHSYDAGLELGRFRQRGGFVTSLGATDAWLFSTALDGAVRAFSLTTSLPKLFPSASDRSGISPVGVVATLGVDTVALRSNQAQAAAATAPERAQLSVEQRPNSESRLSVGAGVAWTLGPQAFAFWDRHEVTTGQLPRPIELLVATPNALELLVAIEGTAPGSNELMRVRHGGPEQAASVLPSRPIALAELGDGPGAVALLASGPLRVVSDIGKAASEVALPDGERSGALGVSPDGARFAVGYSAGTVSVGSLKKGSARSYRVSASAISCIAFGRDERVLVVGDRRGNVAVLDLDTERVFPLFSSNNGPLGCGYDSARERFTFLDAAGLAWSEALDTTPLSFLPPVDDALDRAAHDLARFRGLEAAAAGDNARAR